MRRDLSLYLNLRRAHSAMQSLICMWIGASLALCVLMYGAQYGDMGVRISVGSSSSNTVFVGVVVLLLLQMWFVWLLCVCFKMVYRLGMLIRQPRPVEAINARADTTPRRMRVAVTADSNVARRGHSGVSSRTTRTNAETRAGTVPEPLTMSTEPPSASPAHPHTSSLARNFIRRVVAACATRHILGVHVALLNFGQMHDNTEQPTQAEGTTHVEGTTYVEGTTRVEGTARVEGTDPDILFSHQPIQRGLPAAAPSGYDDILSADIHSVVQNLFVGRQIVHTGCQSYSPVMSALTVALGDALNVIFEKHTNSCIGLQSSGCCDEHLLYCRYEARGSMSTCFDTQCCICCAECDMLLSEPTGVHGRACNAQCGETSCWTHAVDTHNKKGCLRPARQTHSCCQLPSYSTGFGISDVLAYQV